MEKKEFNEKCPKCGSKKIVTHTDSKLREKQKLMYQCFDCNHFWETQFRFIETLTN